MFPPAKTEPPFSVFGFFVIWFYGYSCQHFFFFLEPSKIQKKTKTTSGFVNATKPTIPTLLGVHLPCWPFILFSFLSLFLFSVLGLKSRSHSYKVRRSTTESLHRSLFCCPNYNTRYLCEYQLTHPSSPTKYH